MKINYQVMTEQQKNKKGKYSPDWGGLKKGASSTEELAFIESLERKYEEDTDMLIYDGFVWNLVYITKQKCGHFELFHAPYNIHHPLENTLKQAEAVCLSRECTHCICGRK